MAKGTPEAGLEDHGLPNGICKAGQKEIADELMSCSGTLQQEEIYETAGGSPEEPLRAAATQDDGATDDVSKVIRKLFKADLEKRDKTEGAGPEETLEDVTDDHDLSDTGQEDVVAGSAPAPTQTTRARRVVWRTLPRAHLSGGPSASGGRPGRLLNLTFVIFSSDFKCCCERTTEVKGHWSAL